MSKDKKALHINVPSELHKRLRIRAATLGVSLNTLACFALSEYIGNKKETKKETEEC